MTVASYRVSDRGQMALPAEARRRWGLTDGGAVEVADLGDALVIVPAGRGGLRGLVGAAIDEAGGYASLAAQAASEEPELSSEEHTSELQSLMRSSYAVFCLKK